MIASLEWEVHTEWDWTVAPSDGLYGNDYIGVVFYDASGEIVDSFELIEAELALYHGDKIIEQSEPIRGENGLIFTFTNQLDEHLSYGNIGDIHVVVKSPDIVNTETFFMHTWMNHAPMQSTDATFENVAFEHGGDIPYWVISVDDQ